MRRDSSALKPAIFLLAIARVETPFFHPSDKDPSLGTPASLRIEIIHSFYSGPERMRATTS
jgi:hypothetical protein